MSSKVKREVMTSVPNRRFQNIGYGFIPIASHQWDLRIKAVQDVLGILDGDSMPLNDINTINSLRIVKGMFMAVSSGDQWDWFTTSRMLGFPSSDLSKSLSVRVHRLAHAISQQSDSYFDKCADFLRKNYAPEMLDNYLDVACRKQHPVEEEGWAYVLWSSSVPDEFFIGASGGKIDEVTRQLRVDYPDNDPYGVLGAWLVHDPVLAFNDIREKLGDHSLGCGFYRLELADAKKIVSSTLVGADNHPISPWHAGDEPGDDDEPDNSSSGFRI